MKFQMIFKNGRDVIFEAADCVVKKRLHRRDVYGYL